MKKLARMFGMTALVIWAGISPAQIATGWTLPGHHAPIVRGGDGMIRMDAVNAYSPHGVLLWSKGVGNSDLRATTDGLTYACSTTGEVICLNSTGGQVWKYRNPALQEQFTSMRISGDYLWVVGKRPITDGLGTRFGSTYSKFARLTGAKLHSSEFLLSTDPSINEGAVKIVGNGSANFVVVGGKGASGTLYSGLARMDLDTGNKVSSTFFLTGGEPTGAAVDSQSQIYVVDGSLRKFDGTTSPAITQVWARGSATGMVFISKGWIYTKNDREIVKTLPNGDQTRLVYVGWPDTIAFIAADPAGVIYTMYSCFFYSYPEPLRAYTHVIAIDPATGQGLWTEVLNPEVEATASLSTDAWGTVFASGGGKTVALYRTPDPQPDSYTLPGGRTFTVNAPGLMANDGYTDPFVCQTYKYSNPANGYLTVRNNGSFDYTPKPGFIGQDSFQYEVVRGTFARYTTVNLTMYHAATLTLAKNQIAGQNAMLGTVSLSNTIATNAVITVSDNSSLVTTPPSVTILAGQTAKTFGIQVKPVISVINTAITATYGGYSHTQSLTLLPLVPTSVVLTPSTVVGGNTVSARVIMNGVAGAGGRTFSVRSSSPSAQPPLTIVVPAGQSSYVFPIPTTPVTQSVLTTIRVAATAGEKSAYLRINP